VLEPDEHLVADLRTTPTKKGDVKKGENSQMVGEKEGIYFCGKLPRKIAQSSIRKTFTLRIYPRAFTEM
jgi:hypothetical protein